MKKTISLSLAAALVAFTVSACDSEHGGKFDLLEDSAELDARIVSSPLVTARELERGPILLDPSINVFRFDFRDGTFDWSRVYIYDQTGQVITMQENCQGVFLYLSETHGESVARYFRQIMEGEAGPIMHFIQDFSDLEIGPSGFKEGFTEVNSEETGTQKALCCCSDGVCVETNGGKCVAN